jgi:hypothetical protein
MTQDLHGQGLGLSTFPVKVKWREVRRERYGGAEYKAKPWRQTILVGVVGPLDPAVRRGFL